MSTHYSAIVIGSGQSGTPLVSALARAGRKTALVEASHIGGCCVNEGCTPTKTMVAGARVAYLASRGKEYGVDLSGVGAGAGAGDDKGFKINMNTVRKRKRDIVESFRKGGEGRLAALKESNFELLMGTAKFVSQKEIEVQMQAGEVRKITADDIFINAGCRPTSFELPGIQEHGVDVLNSTTIMELDQVPDHLIVIGGGYVGLEFAQMFRRFGSKVTIMQRSGQLLRKEDPDVSEAVVKILTEDGIDILFNTSPQSISKSSSNAFNLKITTKNQAPRDLKFSHILNATGRIPNGDVLNLRAAGINTYSPGFISVDAQLRTNIEGIYALGDINGGPQHTHVSYDDFRIINANLLTTPPPASPASTRNRLIPYTVFIDPQLGRVGLTQSEALAQGYNIKTAQMPMAYVARALEMDESRGFIKIVVDAETSKILGAAVLGFEGGEVMTMLQVAMMGDLGWEKLRDAIWAHPGLGELLNNVWGFLE